MDFGSLFTAHIEAQGSVVAFANRVRVSPSYVFQNHQRESKIPVKKIEVWADALKLKGASRRVWLERAYLTRPPAYIRDFLRMLRADH